MCMGESSASFESMLVSDDVGATWKQIPLSAQTANLLQRVNNHGYGTYMDFPDSKNGFIMVPGYSSLLCTTDGGNTWKWN